MITHEGRGAAAPTRFDDRDQAGRSMALLIGRLGFASPLLVGIGPGGTEVAAGISSETGWDTGRLDIADIELGDAVHPSRVCGVVAADRELLLPAQIEPLQLAHGALGTAVRMARQQLAPEWSRFSTRDRQVVVVDDGMTPVATLNACMDLVRRGRPMAVTFALACTPAERADLLEKEHGEIVVARVVSWAIWRRWNSNPYLEDERIRYGRND